MADVEKNNDEVSDGDDLTVENFYDLDQRENDTKISELAQKIEALEHEKLGLVNENEETKQKIKALMVEKEGLKSKEAEMTQKLSALAQEIEHSKEGKNALEAVASRAADLEMEVSRLQHDLIQAMSEGDESNSEVVELKKVLGEKEARIEGLEREVEELKTTKDECEIRIRDLERKIGVLEVRETEGKSEKVRFEGQLRGKLEDKEREISEFNKRAEDLEAVIMTNKAELEKWMMEKLGLEEALKLSEEEGKLVKSKMVKLQREVEEAERVISGLKEKTIEAVNGSVNGIRVGFEGTEKGLKLHWPAVAVGFTGSIAAAAMIYVYSKRR